MTNHLRARLTVRVLIANRLAYRIVRLATLGQTDQFPGEGWPS